MLGYIWLANIHFINRELTVIVNSFSWALKYPSYSHILTLHDIVFTHMHIMCFDMCLNNPFLGPLHYSSHPLSAAISPHIQYAVKEFHPANGCKSPQFVQSLMILADKIVWVTELQFTDNSQCEVMHTPPYLYKCLHAGYVHSIQIYST